MRGTRNDEDRIPDWSMLPHEFAYIVEAAERYGSLMALGRPLRRRVKTSERKGLREVALQVGWNNHDAWLQSWIIERSIAGDKFESDLVEGLLFLLAHLGFSVSDYGPKQEPEWSLHLWDVLHYRVLWLMVDQLREVIPDEQAFDVVLKCIARVPARDLPEMAYWMLYPFRTRHTLDWIEFHVTETVSPWYWGWLAALSDFSWPRAKSWLANGRPLSLIALDALSNMQGASESPVVREADPRLAEPVPFEVAAPVLGDYASKDRAPRVERSVESILKRWSNITAK